MREVYGSGLPVAPGAPVKADNFVRSFTVSVRSLGPISANGLKDLIETKYEVVSIVGNEEDDVAVVTDLNNSARIWPFEKSTPDTAAEQRVEAVAALNS